MAGPEDSGKFSTEIPKEVLDAAMDAVEKREKAATEVEVLPPDERDKEIEQLNAQLEVSMAKGRELMGKLKDEHEKMLRAVADLENYKKRVAKEKEELTRFGVEKLMKDFLPVVDNFDRALEHAAKSADYESLKSGVTMIRKLFEDALGKHGVKGFSSVGKAFDPNFHEAMGHQETGELPPNHVSMEMVRGFLMHDRLIRPALVMISKAPESAEAAPAPAEAPETAAAEPSPEGGAEDQKTDKGS